MKKKILFLVLLLFCNLLIAQSPNWLWAKSANGNKFDNGWAVSSDLSGNVYVTGSFTSPTINFGSFTLTNANGSGNFSDIFFVKYDFSGNVLWAKSVGSTYDDWGLAVKADNLGNVYLSGGFVNDTIIFGTDTLINNNSTFTSVPEDIYIAKYDTAGNVLWAKSFGGDRNEQIVTISTSDKGNVFATGMFTSDSITFDSFNLINASSTSTPDFFIVKLDASGNVQWATSAGGINFDHGNSIAADAFGNAYVTGSFCSPTITFGNITLTNMNNNGSYPDIFIVKYDNNGNILWAKSVGGNSGEDARGVASDVFGNLYITGNFASPTITFGSYILTNTVNSGHKYDIFIAKYDPSGNVLWAKSAGGTGVNDKGNAISTDADGNIYVIGGFESPSLIFGSITITPPLNSTDPMFVVKYDPTGIALCANSLASGGGDWDGQKISTDPFGNTYVIGNFRNLANPFIVGSFTLFGGGIQNVFVSKWTCPYYLGINEINPNVSIQIFPNPFSTQTMLLTREILKDATLTVCNSYGQIVREIKNISGPTIILLRDNLPTGLYFLRLRADDKIFIDKLIIT